MSEEESFYKGNTSRPPYSHEAAEEYALQVPYASEEDYHLIIETFVAGYNEGCEHVEKRDREFYLLVRDYFNENDLYYLDSVHRKNVDRISNEIKKHLAAFTEREQQSLPL